AKVSDRSRQLQVGRLYADLGRQFIVEKRYREALPYLLAARQHGVDGAPLRTMFWDVTRHLSLVPALEHRAAVVHAAFSPDGTRVVTASSDMVAQIWDAATGKPLTGPLEHRRPVVSAAFSPDGTRVVTASWDYTARVWDAATGKPLTSPLEHQDAVVSAVF